MKVSVVILNWNGEKFLDKFLPSVLEYTHIPNYEVVVADNASTDNSVSIVESKFQSVRIQKFDKNYGFAGGYNKALKSNSAEYYVLLNSDVEVTENWIKPIIEFMDLHAEVGACMPKLRCYSAPDYFEYAGAAGGYIDKYGYPFCRGRIFDTIEKDWGQYNSIEEIFWATGACLVIRSNAYWQVKGLDERFFAHMEEIDLCWRLQWVGYKVMVFPQSIVYHVGGGALPKENPRKTFLNFRNNLFLLFKNLPKNQLYKIVFLRMCLDFIAAIRYIITFKFKHFWAVFSSHLSFYLHLPYLLKFRKSATYLKHNNPPTQHIFQKSIVKTYFVNKLTTYKQLTNE